jgi:hypothetical protein
MANNAPDQPQVDERLLHHLTLVAAVLRNEAIGDAKNHSKHWWQYFLEPSVLTALVTVLIGGLFGGLITAMYQAAQKDREFQQSWLKTRGDQALTSYKEYLDREQELIRRAYALVGACVSASDRLAYQTGPPFRAEFINQPEVENQKNAIKKNFNQMNAKWLSEKEELGLLMNYYHPDHPGVIIAWRKVRDSVTRYTEWAANWNNDHQPPKPPPGVQEIKDGSKPLYDALSSDLDELSKALESVRDYPWKGWESPQKMKTLLEASEK